MVGFSFFVLNRKKNTILMNICMVCNVSAPDVRSRNMAVACSACGSFFRNNHEHLLICKTGLHNCFNDEVLNLNQSKSIVCSNGKTWRFACSRCRFDKCVKVGMRVIRRNFKNRPSLPDYDKMNLCQANNWKGSTTSIGTSISLDDSHLFEHELCTMVTNWQKWIKEYINSAPGFSRKCSSSFEVLNMFNENTESNAKQFSIFLKNCTNFLELPGKEHCHLFTLGLGKLTLLNFALVDKPMFANEETIQIALDMPYLFIKEKRIWLKEIRSIVELLNITPVELVFVSYFLYLDNSGNFPTILNHFPIKICF